MKEVGRLVFPLLTFLIVFSIFASIPDVVAPPRTEDLLFRFYYTPVAAYTGLKADEIDLVANMGWSAGLPLHDGTQLPADAIEDAMADPSIWLAPVEGNDVTGFDFNNNYSVPDYPSIRSPTSYRSFRQALAYLVDKDYIVETLKGGLADRIDVPIPTLQSSWWNPAVTGLAYPYNFNSALADALLNADGFVQGYEPNPYYDPAFPGSAPYLRVYPPGNEVAGATLDPIIFCVRVDDSAMLQGGRLLVDYARKLGIPVNVIEGGPTSLYDRVMGGRNYHVYTGGWVVKKRPIYLYSLYHNVSWYPYGANYVTGVNNSGGSNYPLLDSNLTLLWSAPAVPAALLACQNAQQIMIDECISVWLYSSRSYVPYRNLLGIVNMDGYGPVNKYTFMNAYKPDGSPIRVGIVSPPIQLNVLYSQWMYDWLCLDTIYLHLFNEAPYDLSVDQPWAAQDWYVDTWFDPDASLWKTRVTYWLRDNIYWVQPVTGDLDGQLTAYDVNFSIWYNCGYNDAWHWNDVASIHHTSIVDDLCIEVYFDVLSCWAAYWIGEQLPLIPEALWTENVVDPRGYTPGNLPWETILEGAGMYYATALGPYDSITLKRNPFFWLETPVLGDIDFIWHWNGYDESRRIDESRAPRHGCYSVDSNDAAIVAGAWDSQGQGVPDPNWFPGADLASEGGVIDIVDASTVTGNLGRSWGCTMPLPDVHDVAVIGIETSKTGCLPVEVVGEGRSLHVNVTVQNQGDFAETFSVAVFANGTQVGSQPATLNPGEVAILTFTWNTLGFEKGNYLMGAVADNVAGEIDTADNALDYGYTFLTLAGDVDGDRDVDIFDIVRMAGGYGTLPPNPKYNPNCDVDGDGDIDIFDLVRAAGNYGRSW